MSSDVAGGPPPPDPSPTAEAPVDADDVLVEDLAVEAEVEPAAPDYLDDLRRLQAEFENYRKRVARQQSETAERAAESLVSALLPVLDAAELAASHGEAGVEKVAGMLFDVLAKEGLEGIAPEVGSAFDPTVHEAAAHEDGDTEHPEVVEMWRAGYRWKGRLLRPATVKVKG